MHQESAGASKARYGTATVAERAAIGALACTRQKHERAAGGAAAPVRNARLTTAVFACSTIATVSSKLQRRRQSRRNGQPRTLARTHASTIGMLRAAVNHCRPSASNGSDILGKAVLRCAMLCCAALRCAVRERGKAQGGEGGGGGGGGRATPCHIAGVRLGCSKVYARL